MHNCRKMLITWLFVPESDQIKNLKATYSRVQTPSKITKNGNFRYKFAPKRKFWGFIEKVEYRCTTTNLPLCNDIIIVLKITLLHSVSVITNFVIPKRDKQRTNQKTSQFFVYSRRATHDPHHTWQGNKGGPSHLCTPLNFLIQSVVLPLWAIEICGKMPTLQENAYNLVVCPRKRPN